MQKFLVGLCAGVALAIVANPATDSNATTPVRKTLAEASAPAGSLACLGGMIAEGHTGDYLAVADYPAFAALTTGLKRFFICGDSIPSFLPSSERAGFASRRR
jgi:hypothetical protein